MYSLNFYLSLEFMISSFISSNPSGTLFIKTNLSWLIFESIKALETTTFMLFNLDLAKDNILSCFFFVFYFLIIDPYFLIPAVITKIFSNTYRTTD